MTMTNYTSLHFPIRLTNLFLSLITTVSDNNQVMNLKYVVGVTLEKSRGGDKQDNFIYPVIQCEKITYPELRY